MPEMNAIWNLASRSYWRRLWVIQETQLALNLVLWCGKKQVDASNLKTYGHWMWRRGYLSPVDKPKDRILKTPGWGLLDQRGLEPKSIFTWLVWCNSWGSLCPEPKDAIYALLGIAGDCQKERILPNYSRSVLDLYKDVLSIFDGMDPRFWNETTPIKKQTSSTNWTILNNIALRFGLIDESEHIDISQRIKK